VKDMESKDVQAFSERVAGDWDTMRLAYYDERVIERLVAVSGAADVWLSFEAEQVEGFSREAGLTSYGYESLGMQ
jgi:hypothetical protein